MLTKRIVFFPFSVILSVWIAGPIKAQTMTKPYVPIPVPLCSAADELSAIKNLSSTGVPADEQHFYTEIDTGTLPVIKLFLKAGFSPNYVNSSGFFISVEDILDNSNNPTDILNLLVENGLDMKKLAPASCIMCMMYHRQFSQEEQLFYMAMLRPNAASLFSMIYKAGGRPTSLLAFLSSLEKAGDPLFRGSTQSGFDWLNKAYPNWQSVDGTNISTQPAISFSELNIRHIGLQMTKEDVIADAKASGMTATGVKVLGQVGAFALDLRDPGAQVITSSVAGLNQMYNQAETGQTRSGMEIYVIFSAKTAKSMEVLAKVIGENGDDFGRGPLYDAAVKKFGNPTSFDSDIPHSYVAYFGPPTGPHAEYYLDTSGGWVEEAEQTGQAEPQFALRIVDPALVEASEKASAPPGPPPPSL